MLSIAFTKLSAGSPHWAYPPSKYLFGTYPLYCDEAAVLVDHAVNKLGKKRLAVFYLNDDYGKVGLIGTQIVFMGKGFQPEDSVFISLLGVKTKDQVVDIPIADGDVDNNGYFNVELGSDLIAMVFKIGVLLRAKSGVNEKGEKFIIISQPPIPEG
ncbi:unnamed protein product, partial [marine sediment metagenome]